MQLRSATREPTAPVSQETQQPTADSESTIQENDDIIMIDSPNAITAAKENDRTVAAIPTITPPPWPVAPFPSFLTSYPGTIVSAAPRSAYPGGPFVLDMPLETTYLAPIPCAPNLRTVRSDIPIATSTCTCKLHTVARRISVLVACNKRLYPHLYNAFQHIRADLEMGNISVKTALRQIRENFLRPLRVTPQLIGWDFRLLDGFADEEEAGWVLEHFIGFFREEALAMRYTYGEMILSRIRVEFGRVMKEKGWRMDGEEGGIEGWFVRWHASVAKVAERMVFGCV